MNFGTNLRNIRIQHHLTQQKLADDLNISQASIAAYEKNIREPNFEIIRKLADYFHVPPSTLMPFEKVSDDEYIQKIADSLYANPKLGILFDKAKYLTDSELDAVLAVVNAISKERGYGA